MGKLKIEHLVLGQVETNCYLAMNEETKALLIVDPADQAEEVIRRIEDMGGHPAAVLLTHGHFDHIGAAKKLRETYGISVYGMEDEAEIMASQQLNLAKYFGCSTELTADVLLKDGQELELAGFSIQVLHTPGHTKGGACYYLKEEEVLFSGDTLFRESVGRSDFPTGNMQVLIQSIKNKLMVLPEETRVFPGHNGESTIGHEKRYNPFLGR